VREYVLAVVLKIALDLDVIIAVVGRVSAELSRSWLSLRWHQFEECLIIMLHLLCKLFTVEFSGVSTYAA
jgi:hypothetical protein